MTGKDFLKPFNDSAMKASDVNTYWMGDYYVRSGLVFSFGIELF